MFSAYGPGACWRHVQEAEWVADELRVTCLLCTSSSLWVGTADGTLLIYDVTASQTTTNSLTKADDVETWQQQTKTASDQSNSAVRLLMSAETNRVQRYCSPKDRTRVQNAHRVNILRSVLVFLNCSPFTLLSFCLVFVETRGAAKSRTILRYSIQY